MSFLEIFVILAYGNQSGLVFIVRVCGCHVNKETKMVEKKVISVFGLLKSVDFHRANGMIEVLLKMRMIALA